MTSSGQVIARVAHILEKSTQYPWKTARYLRTRLAEEGISVTTKALEATLLEHARRPDRRLRYSFFPARNSLDLLWGHVAVVNDSSRLPDPRLESQFGDFERCKVHEGHPWCFLSHSFRDLPVVRSIYRSLLERGYGVWLAEAEVMTDVMIVEAVQKGLGLCDRFVLYATRYSLGSRWVLKEGIDAITRRSMPVTVVTDPRDEELAALFSDWLENRWDGLEESRIAALASDAPPEPAATALTDLLVAGLGVVPPERRVVVSWPASGENRHGGFRDFDSEFPCLAGDG